MMFTTKTEYGMRAMMVLTKADKENPISLAQIARDEKISHAYLERLFKKLKTDNLIKSTKGVNGGYYLARNSKEINMFQIVQSLEGPLSVSYCMNQDEKDMTCNPNKCLAKTVWNELQRDIIKRLRGFTLADLA